MNCLMLYLNAETNIKSARISLPFMNKQKSTAVEYTRVQSELNFANQAVKLILCI